MLTVPKCYGMILSHWKRAGRELMYSNTILIYSCNCIDMADYQDQQFLEFIIKAIVNHPDQVKVTRSVDERGVLMTLDVEPTDIGYVIGRHGNTIRAIRTLLKVVGAKNNALVNLKINEPEGGQRERRSETVSTMDDVDTSAIDNLDI